MDPFIQESLNDANNSPAGRLLASHGFKAVHQGGEVLNFIKDMTGYQLVVMAEEGDGWVPEILTEPVEVYRRDDSDGYDEYEDRYENVNLFLAKTFPAQYLSQNNT